MTIEEAIKKAIGGGWRGGIREGKLDGQKHSVTSERMFYSLSSIFLDPSFWSSLGKALGWGEDGVCKCEGDTCHEVHGKQEWKYYWHRFIDHLASGGTAQTFFETL